jgi:hypothetical protein
MEINEITEKLWQVKHLTHKVVGRNGFPEILHECAIITDEGQKVAAITLDFLGLDAVPRAEAEWRLAEHVVSTHNVWLALKDNSPKVATTNPDKATEVTNGNRGKWFTDGTRDVKAKECPPGFRPGRSSAFKRKDAGHEEAPQTPPTQSPVAQHQVQGESDRPQDRVQETTVPQTGEGWFRP